MLRAQPLVDHADLIATELGAALTLATGRGGRTEDHTPESRVAAIVDALSRWYERVSDTKTRWSDTAATSAWNTHIRPLLGEALPALPEDAERAARKRHTAQVHKKLEPVARALLTRHGPGVAALYKLWSDRWHADDAHWGHRLKRLDRWLLPRGLRKRRIPATHGARASSSPAWNVGGLSMVRITTLRELYQTRKAHHARPRPDNPRAGAERIESESARGDKFGDRSLRAMERLREQRVKQLSSRIIEAALGLGRHAPSTGQDRDRHRPRHSVDAPCHAVVIENLRNYRPDDLRLRRENKALMNWATGKVRACLEESCQLYGLHLREVLPKYTSRQCSRTGQPGHRCVDVRIDTHTGTPKGSWWPKALAGARKKLEASKHAADAESRFIVDLADHLADLKARDKPLPQCVRLLRAGGDLFLPVDAWNTKPKDKYPALQADLNAAANIGLRALMDPDFEGKWWYIACDNDTGKPAKDKYTGAACLDLDTPLLPPASETKNKRDKRNAWKDPLTTGDRSDAGKYWNGVKLRATNHLRVHNAMYTSNDSNIANFETPW